MKGKISALCVSLLIAGCSSTKSEKLANYNMTLSKVLAVTYKPKNFEELTESAMKALCDSLDSLKIEHDSLLFAPRDPEALTLSKDSTLIKKVSSYNPNFVLTYSLTKFWSSNNDRTFTFVADIFDRQMKRKVWT